MIGDFSLIGIIVLLVVLLVSMTIHEFMHAYVGHKLGDTTAHDEGRLSLNPLRHIDPLLTIVLPVITLVVFQAPILAARPVPFNPDRIKYDEYGAALLAAAGPLSNLALACVASVFLQVVAPGSLVGDVMRVFLLINVGLFVFNLIPIPPLDGSRVLYAFAPDPLRRIMETLEPFGFFIIMALVLLGGFGSLIVDLNQMVLNFLL